MSSGTAVIVFAVAMLALAVYCWSQVVRGLRRGRMRFAGNSPNTYQTRDYQRGAGGTVVGFWLGIVAFTLGGLASSAGLVIAGLLAMELRK